MPPMGGNFDYGAPQVQHVSPFLTAVTKDYRDPLVHGWQSSTGKRERFGERSRLSGRSYLSADFTDYADEKGRHSNGLVADA